MAGDEDEWRMNIGQRGSPERPAESFYSTRPDGEEHLARLRCVPVVDELTMTFFVPA